MRSITGALAVALLFASVGAATRDTGSIEGRVTVEDGRSSPGVLVTIGEASVPTRTDADGRFSLRLTYNEAFHFPTYAEFFLRFPLFPTDTTTLNDVCTQPRYKIDCGLAGPTTNYFLGNESLRLEEATTLELGYKGILGGKASLTVDLWSSENEDFVTSSLQVTPTGRANPGIPTWVGPPAAEMTPIDPGDCPVPGFPGGTVADCVRASALDLLAPMGSGSQLTNLDGAPILAFLSNTNFGRVDPRGVDVGLDYFFDRRWRFSAAYSWFDFDVGQATGGNPGLLLPNAPEHKASVGLAYVNDRSNASIHGRWVDEYFWFGTPAGTVKSFTTVDMRGNYALSESWKVGVTVANVFDDEHREAFGADRIRRRALVHTTFSW